MSRRMRLFIALLFATLAFYTLTIPLSPVHSQGETPTQTYLIAAGDALALTEALAGANHAAEFGDVATVIYLEGGTYTFALPGSPSQPILPTVRGNLTLYGNNATLLFRYLETPLYPGITPIIIMPQGDLTIHHATLRVMEGNGRAITNYGALHILDAVIDTGDPTAAEGGIINEGELLISRTTFAHHRQRSAAAVGGAIYNVGQMSITCGRFLNNRASQGGAIYNAEGGTAAIHESYFEGNYGNGGGAVFNGAESPLDASGNWWGADGVPEVNETTFVADAVSTSVTFMPAAVSDPTQTSGCASPPPQTPPIPATPPPANAPVPPPDLRSPLSYGGCPQAGQGNTCLYTLMPDGTTRQISGLQMSSPPVWSPDGQKAAYQSWRHGRGELFVYDTLTWGEIQVTESWGWEDSHPTWSPDGVYLLFDSNRHHARYDAVWLVKADGTQRLSPTPIGVPPYNAMPYPRYPTFSPDGTTIALTHRASANPFDPYGLWLLRRDTFGAWTQTAHLVYLYYGDSGRPAFPQWSPDGTRLYYTLNGVIRRVNDVATAVYYGTTLVQGGQFDLSPDGTQIAYVYQQTSPTMQTQYRLAEADGSNPRLVMALPGQSNADGLGFGQASGGRIVFASARDEFRTGNEGDLEIFTANPDGSGLQQLTENTVTDTQPAFSPDGTRIAYISTLNGNRDLFIMNADGTNPINLTNSPSVNEDEPAWSPDSTRIAFTSDNDGRRSNIWMIILATGQPMPLTSLTGDVGTWDTSPAWSPEGTRIVFVRIGDNRLDPPPSTPTPTPPPGTRDPKRRLIILEIATGLETAIPVAEPAYDSAWMPVLTAEGKHRIAFVSEEGGSSEIYCIDFDLPLTQASVFRVTDGAGWWNDSPAWSPDGNSFLFVSNRTGSSRDGSSVAVTLERPGNRRLWTATPIQNSALTPITAGIDGDIAPSWGRSSAVLVIPPSPPTINPDLELAKYGVEATGGWSTLEKLNILAGVRKTALALAMHTRHMEIGNTSGIPAEGRNAPSDVFRRVMAASNPSAPTLIRIMRQTGAQTTHCEATAIGTPQGVDALIQCNYAATAVMSEHTIVHELGHVFYYRSGRGNPYLLNVGLGDYIEDPSEENRRQINSERVIRDNLRTDLRFEERPVMGVVVQQSVLDWQRGKDGWGSGPATINEGVGRRFQQNAFDVPQPYDAGGSQAEEYEETGADMFLNWVYRMVLDDLSLDTGFKNRAWRIEVSLNVAYCQRKYLGCEYTAHRPGDKRFDWMNRVLQAIFDGNSTTWKN